MAPIPDSKIPDLHWLLDTWYYSSPAQNLDLVWTLKLVVLEEWVSESSCGGWSLRSKCFFGLLIIPALRNYPVPNTNLTQDDLSKTDQALLLSSSHTVLLHLFHFLWATLIRNQVCFIQALLPYVLINEICIVRWCMNNTGHKEQRYMTL